MRLLLPFLFTVGFAMNIHAQDILSIDGLDFGAGIVIMWETSDEPEQGQKFIIERALNANSDFEKVGEIIPDTEAGLKNYTFEDRELGLKLAFYRIKTVEELEGVESYSEVVPVKKDVINNFKIQEVEELDKDQYRVSVLSVAEGTLKYQLATNMGEVVMLQDFNMIPGENDFMVDLNTEADGAYIASFQNEAYTVTKNFSKKSKKNDNVARKD